MTTQLSVPVQPGESPDALRQAAMTQLRKKRDLQAHILAYVTVNLFLNVIWFLATPGGFYWPMFPLFGWGTGLVFHVWDVYSYRTLSEERIQREMQRLRPR